MGGVFCLVLNSQFYFDALACPELQKAQEAWLEEQLSRAATTVEASLDLCEWGWCSRHHRPCYLFRSPNPNTSWCSNTFLCTCKAQTRKTTTSTCRRPPGSVFWTDSRRQVGRTEEWGPLLHLQLWLSWSTNKWIDLFLILRFTGVLRQRFIPLFIHFCSDLTFKMCFFATVPVETHLTFLTQRITIPLTFIIEFI